MARDEIQMQSTRSKKRGWKYKDIIKNGEFCRIISIEVMRNKIGYEYSILYQALGVKIDEPELK
jgi:hypothetical protein